MPEDSQREILPIPDRAYSGFVAYDAKNPDSSFPAIEPLRPPAGAPNVLVVLLDDVGFGASSSSSAPGHNSLRPNTAAPLAETLKLNGYSTAQFGKCHEVPVWQTSPMGSSTPGRPAAGGSSTSSGSSAARPTSTTRRSTRTPSRWSSTRRPKRATTLWRI